MTDERSTRDSRPTSEARCRLRRGGGFTLSNLVSTMGFGAMVLTVLSSQLTARLPTDAELEVEQGVRAAVAMLSEEIDGAGKCLPSGGAFIAMQAANQKSADSLTVRVGRFDPASSACVRSTLTNGATSGDRQLEVESNRAFRTGDRVLVADDGSDGSYHTITSVTEPSRIDIEPAMKRDLPQGASVFALEERHYAIGTERGRSVLTVQVNGGKRRPLVDGLGTLDLTYRLADGSESSAAPAGEAEWRLVNEISLAVAAESRTLGSDAHRVQRAAVVSTKPRHVL